MALQAWRTGTSVWKRTPAELLTTGPSQVPILPEARPQPHNHISNNTRVGWVSEPNERGTVGLLYSCLFTIFICTWSTLHMNVPADDESPSRIFFRKLRWMGVALILPEYLFVLAVRELLSVRLFYKGKDRVRCTEEVCNINLIFSSGDS